MLLKPHRHCNNQKISTPDTFITLYHQTYNENSSSISPGVYGRKFRPESFQENIYNPIRCNKVRGYPAWKTETDGGFKMKSSICLKGDVLIKWKESPRRMNFNSRLSTPTNKLRKRRGQSDKENWAELSIIFLFSFFFCLPESVKKPTGVTEETPLWLGAEAPLHSWLRWPTSSLITH